MKKKQIHCPYCGAKASLRPASAVYGTATKVPDSYLYVCDRYPRCDSYVGAHKRTKEPMGTLANGDLRNKRIQAHKAFDWMWKSGLMTKWQAYKWMQGMEVVDNASDENNENTRRKATVVPIKIEYV